MKTKKIGIIGSGIVAQTLGTGLLKEGHQITLGTRSVSKLDDWKSENQNANVASFREAAENKDLIILAVQGAVAIKALELIGEETLEGKTVIDATNPIDPDAAPENGVLKFFTDLNESLLERIQNRFPKTNFVKAWSSVGSTHMIHPQFDSQPSMFICGNQEEPKKLVTELLESVGWEVLDFGHAESARAIEPLCILWCIPGFQNGQWSHAFKLLKQ